MRKSGFSTIICTLTVLLSFYQLCPAMNEFKIKPSDGEANDEFGRSVSISSDRCIVGVSDDEYGHMSGSAYIFGFNGTEWIQKAKLMASDGAEYDHFGNSVSISGDRCIAGANGNDDRGAAYIFEFNGTEWIQQAKIKASDGSMGDSFGCSVSISGDRCIAGAYGEDDNGSGSGAAYIFEFNGTAWIQKAKIKASDGTANDRFGGSVSISSDRCIVGADFDDDKGDRSGSAYIFEFNGTSWIQKAKLAASDGAIGDFFGWSVSISGDRCIVGAIDENESRRGEAYIFEFNGTKWTQKTKITASDGAAEDYFGYSVSISGDRCIVGAYCDDDNGSESGSAYLFEFNGTAWMQKAKITASDGAAGDYFGESVSISGDRCIAGALLDDDNGDRSGSAYIYIYHKAFNPYPEAGATGVDPNVVLSWLPGYQAVSHNVYLGTGYSDVNNADTSSPEYKGNYDVNYWDPCGLELSTTYYWRVDEINEPNIWKGNVWSFRTISPIIEISAMQFEFTAAEGGTNPADQILGISNIGADTLHWQISEGCNWLSVEPSSGSSTGETDEITLSVDISGLPLGLYACELTVSDPNAVNNPQTIYVTLSIDAGNILLVPTEYGTIQAAIDASVNGDTVIVTPGTYTGTGNKNLDFGGKAITVRSSDPENPSVVAATVIDCENSGRGFYFHSGEGPDSIILGLTIKNGKVTGWPAAGGGIYCSGSSPTIENCIITNNTAYGSNGRWEGEPGGSAYGGGICCQTGSSPIVVNCTISNNIADAGDGGEAYEGTPAGPGGDAYGGGIYCSADVGITVEDCNITGNGAYGGEAGYSENVPNGDACGGGIYGEVMMNNSILSGNLAKNDHGWWGTAGIVRGGGIFCLGSSSVTNCLIFENEVIYSNTGELSDSYGGAIYGSDITVSNCTIYGNTASDYGSGGNGYGGIYCNGTATITDCIVWGNEDDLYGCSATYSCIEDNDSGTGNIHDDPCFVTGPRGNYYLSQIAAGQAFTSPCVDAGSDTAANLGMATFTTRTDKVIDEGIVDMGYHYSESILPPADIDKDGDIDLADYAILASQWLEAPGEPSADIAPPGGDGIVDFLDLGMFADNWQWRASEEPSEPNAPVAHWKFDEGGGTIVHDSAGDNDGTIYGSVIWTTGQIGGALYFHGYAGDDHVSIPDVDNSLDMDNEMTITTWVKPVDNENMYCIVSKTTGTFTSNYVFSIDFGMLTLYHDSELYSTEPLVTAGVWQHVAVTLKEGDSVKFYINGAPAGTSSQTEPFGIINNEPLLIGKWMDEVGLFYGDIDDVRIYDRELTAEEVEQVYEEGL